MTVPADPRIDAAARAWVGDKSDGTNPMDVDDEFSAHNRVRMAKALAAADAALTPPPEIDISIQMPEITPDTVVYRISLPAIGDAPPKVVFTLYADGRGELGEGSQGLLRWDGKQWQRNAG